eukprot:Pgem_evm1s18944
MFPLFWYYTIENGVSKVFAKSSYISAVQVWREGLWVKLFECSIKGRLWRVIRQMYKNNRSTVLVDGEDCDMFDVIIGVRRGDVLSPTLFKIFINFNSLIIDDIINSLNLDLSEDELCSVIRYLLYAVDIALVAVNDNDLDKLINCLVSFCKKWRLEINFKKSGIMIVVQKDGPIITYSCEIWWCDAVQLKKLESLQLCGLKWILGCSDTTSSSYVRNELGIEKLEYQLIKLRLKWFAIVIAHKNVNIIGK